MSLTVPPSVRGLLFDLDGVLVDTAVYHYQAWRRLAQELGFEFTLEQNERLKGVSRLASLEILLAIGGLSLSEAEKEVLAHKKNQWYVELISTMTPAEVLPGVVEFLREARRSGLRTAVASASKNAPFILQRVGLEPFFDAVIDGTSTTKAKPDPEVFLLAARALGLAPEECLVFEDAEAGIQAAHAAGMPAVGIGSPRNLPLSDFVLRGFPRVGVDFVLAQHQLLNDSHQRNTHVPS